MSVAVVTVKSRRLCARSEMIEIELGEPTLAELTPRDFYSPVQKVVDRLPTRVQPGLTANSARAANKMATG